MICKSSKLCFLVIDEEIFFFGCVNVQLISPRLLAMRPSGFEGTESVLCMYMYVFRRDGGYVDQEDKCHTVGFWWGRGGLSQAHHSMISVQYI